MIIVSDCDQFNTAVCFGTFPILKNSIIAPNVDFTKRDTKFDFIPRELFNMKQLQIIYLNPYNIKNIIIANQIPTSIRKNLTSMNLTFMQMKLGHAYAQMFTNYLNGGIFGEWRHEYL